MVFVFRASACSPVLQDNLQRCAENIPVLRPRVICRFHVKPLSSLMSRHGENVLYSNSLARKTQPTELQLLLTEDNALKIHSKQAVGNLNISIFICIFFLLISTSHKCVCSCTPPHKSLQPSACRNGGGRGGDGLQHALHTDFSSSLGLG